MRKNVRKKIEKKCEEKNREKNGKNIETNHTNPRLEFSEDSFDQTYVVVSKVVSFFLFLN